MADGKVTIQTDLDDKGLKEGLEKAKKTATEAGKDIAKSFNDTTKSTQQVTSAQEKLNTATAKVKAQADTTASSLNKEASNLNNVKTATEQVANSTEKAKKSSENLDTANKKVSKSTEDVGNKSQDSAKKVESFGSKVGSTAKKIGSATFKGVVVGVGAAASAVTGLVGAAVSSYSSYEQLVGGIDTLFKDSSQKLQDYASVAYKTAQLSANDYMETATSFAASLLQGLEGDTDKATELANKAIIDMSDNANKMGTSMESIQYAYQGFAKQNYTMLDNLKLGYGGTASEMARLVKDSGVLGDAADDLTAKNLNEKVTFDQIIEAIHITQERLDITGTSAREAATTIEGSVNMMKSSWTNLVTGMARDDADFQQLMDEFVESTTATVSNIIPRIEIALQGVGTLITSLLPVILNEIPTIINDILPQFIQSGVDMIQSIILGLTSSLPQIWDTLVSLLDYMVQTLIEIGPTLLESGANLLWYILDGFIEKIPETVPTILDFVQNFADTIASKAPDIIQTGFGMLNQLVEGIISCLPILIEKVPKIITTFANIINDNFPTIIAMGFSLLLKLISGIISCIPTLIANIPQIIEAIVSSLLAFNWISLGGKLITLLGDGIEAMFSFIGGIGEDLLNAITSPFENGFSALYDIGSNLIEGLWNGISDMTGWIVDKVRGFGSTVLDGIKDFFGIHSPSRVMKDQVGRYIAEGVGVGFTENDPMQQITSDLTNGYNTLQAKLNSDMQADMNRSYQAISEGSDVNVNVVLEGDAKGVFRLVKTENDNIKKSNGRGGL